MRRSLGSNRSPQVSNSGSSLGGTAGKHVSYSETLSMSQELSPPLSPNSYQSPAPDIDDFNVMDSPTTHPGLKGQFASAAMQRGGGGGGGGGGVGGGGRANVTSATTAQQPNAPVAALQQPKSPLRKADEKRSPPPTGNATAAPPSAMKGTAAALARQSSTGSLRDDDAGTVCSGSTAVSMFDYLSEYLATLVDEVNILDDDGTPMSPEKILSTLAQNLSFAVRSMAPNGIVVMDRQCTVVDFNPKAEEVFGRPRSEVVGKNIKMLMPPEVASKHDDYVRDYLERYERRRRAPKSAIVGTKIGREVLALRMTNGKSTTFPAEIVVRGIPHPGGRALPPLFFVGYVEDVSQRRQLREALEINEFIREKGSTPLIIISDFGKVLDFNAAASDLFRYSRKFVVGQNIKKLCPPNIAAMHDQKLQQWRERVVSNMMHSSPVVGKARELMGYRPKFEEDGCEEFRIELRVEAFSGGKILVAFIRDLEQENQSKFMQATTNDTFPAHTVDRLIRNEAVWDRQEHVTVMFTDLVQFSAQTAGMEAEEVFTIVNSMVSAFDELGYGMEKIKTIGDGYMAYFSSADDAVYTALRMLQWCGENSTNIRIGLHTGTVVSGVIGTRRRTFDMWGASVNFSKRMEETGVANQLQISVETYDSLMNDGLCKLFVERVVTVKSLGEVDVYVTDFQNHGISPAAVGLLVERDVIERQKHGDEGTVFGHDDD